MVNVFLMLIIKVDERIYRVTGLSRILVFSFAIFLFTPLERFLCFLNYLCIISLIGL